MLVMTSAATRGPRRRNDDGERARGCPDAERKPKVDLAGAFVIVPLATLVVGYFASHR